MRTGDCGVISTRATPASSGSAADNAGPPRPATSTAATRTARMGLSARHLKLLLPIMHHLPTLSHHTAFDVPKISGQRDFPGLHAAPVERQEANLRSMALLAAESATQQQQPAESGQPGLTAGTSEFGTTTETTVVRWHGRGCSEDISITDGATRQVRRYLLATHRQPAKCGVTRC